MVSLSDVDDFLDIKRKEGCLPRTIASFCSAFKFFFRFAELGRSNSLGIARGIRPPRVSRFNRSPKTLPWKNVQQLLNCEGLTKPADLRAAAILFLCSIYALRSSEVVNLTLDDFDWINETFTVRRAKRGRIQQYPIQFEVGEVILKYLQHGRPRSSCRTLFLTLKPPTARFGQQRCGLSSQSELNAWDLIYSLSALTHSVVHAQRSCYAKVHRCKISRISSDIVTCNQ